VKTLKLPGPPGVRFVPVTAMRKVEARAMDACPQCKASVPDGAAECPACGYAMNAQGGDGSETFEVAVSSEYVVQREVWGMRWREVLDHSPGSIDLGRFSSGRAAVLEEHRGSPIGVIDSVALGDDKVLRANIRFSRSQRGQEVQQDVEDGIRSNISVGYIPKRATLVEQNDEQGDLWRFNEWEPIELSVVGIPADPSVGVGRSEGGADFPPVIVEDGRAVRTEEERTMLHRSVKFNEGGAGGGGAAPVPEQKREVAPVTSGPDPNVREVVALAEANGMLPKVAGWLERNLTPGQVAMEILKEKRTKGAASGLDEEALGLPERDVKRYSYARAILGAAARAEGGKFDGLEAEISAELEGKLAPSIERRGGIFVPLRLGNATRALTSVQATKGAELVTDQQGELIELLRNRTAIFQRGARSLTGLTAPIAFPKQTTAIAATWQGENPPSDIADSDIALGLALLSPKTLQASTGYSRQLLIQTSIDVEAMVRDELALIHAIALDRAALHGKGTSEPTGIYKAAGVSKKAFGGPSSYLLLLAMQGQVAGLNADLGSLGWITHPTVATNLRGVLDFPSAAAGRPIWTGTYQDGTMVGYGASATNQVSSSMLGSEATGGSEFGVVFGNWADLIVAGFGGFELVVDPYRLKKRGIIEVTSFQMADILPRHGESFSCSTGATG
jgi:HK97 family phage major capsid protein/HK97 family phage prohead protease